jgi:hypothetical protein
MRPSVSTRKEGSARDNSNSMKVQNFVLFGVYWISFRVSAPSLASPCLHTANYVYFYTVNIFEQEK